VLATELELGSAYASCFSCSELLLLFPWSSLLRCGTTSTVLAVGLPAQIPAKEASLCQLTQLAVATSVNLGQNLAAMPIKVPVLWQNTRANRTGIWRALLQRISVLTRLMARLAATSARALTTKRALLDTTSVKKTTAWAARLTVSSSTVRTVLPTSRTAWLGTETTVLRQSNSANPATVLPAQCRISAIKTMEWTARQLKLSAKLITTWAAMQLSKLARTTTRA